MIKKSKNLYIIFLCISIIGFIFTVIYATIEPKMINGYGVYTTIIMSLIFGYHIYFYTKELRLMKNQSNASSKTK